MGATSELAKVSDELKRAKAEVTETRKRLCELEENQVAQAGHVAQSPVNSARITEMRDKLKSSQERYDRVLEQEQNKQQQLAQARSNIYKVDRRAKPAFERMVSTPKVFSALGSSASPPIVVSS